jgi:hypothetical protein
MYIRLKLPENVAKWIDSKRGDINRTKFIVRMIETFYSKDKTPYKGSK